MERTRDSIAKLFGKSPNERKRVINNSKLNIPTNSLIPLGTVLYTQSFDYKYTLINQLCVPY